MAASRAASTEAEVRGKSPAELEAAIAATRARIGADLDALAYRLSPERFRERARGSLEEVQEVVMSTVQEVAQAVAERTKEASSSFFELAKANPLPAALIGLGLGLLAAGGATAARGRWQERDERGGTDSAASAGEAYYGQAYDYRPAPEDASGRNRRGLAHWVEEQPLAAGLLGVILGAAIGLGLPGTRYENELLGPRRDAAFERASEAARHAADALKESVRELRQNAQAQLEQRDLTPEGLKARVAEVGREVRGEAEAAAREVAERAKDALRRAEGGKEGGEG